MNFPGLVLLHVCIHLKSTRMAVVGSSDVYLVRRSLFPPHVVAPDVGVSGPAHGAWPARTERGDVTSQPDFVWPNDTCHEVYAISPEVPHVDGASCKRRWARITPVQGALIFERCLDSQLHRQNAANKETSENLTAEDIAGSNCVEGKSILARSGNGNTPANVLNGYTVDELQLGTGMPSMDVCLVTAPAFEWRAQQSAMVCRTGETGKDRHGAVSEVWCPSQILHNLQLTPGKSYVRIEEVRAVGNPRTYAPPLATEIELLCVGDNLAQENLAPTAADGGGVGGGKLGMGEDHLPILREALRNYFSCSRTQQPSGPRAHGPDVSSSRSRCESTRSRGRLMHVGETFTVRYGTDVAHETPDDAKSGGWWESAQDPCRASRPMSSAHASSACLRDAAWHAQRFDLERDACCHRSPHLWRQVPLTPGSTVSGISEMRTTTTTKVEKVAVKNDCERPPHALWQHAWAPTITFRVCAIKSASEDGKKFPQLGHQARRSKKQKSALVSFPETTFVLRSSTGKSYRCHISSHRHLGHIAIRQVMGQRLDCRAHFHLLWWAC